jgi:aconitate hydratase
MWRDKKTPDPVFTDSISLDLDTVEPSLAGPKRPQDRVPLSAMKASWEKSRNEYFTGKVAPDKTMPVAVGGQHVDLGHGAVVIAAITSCTNTSNPAVMLGAGLLARKAVARGLRVKPWVKTSLAPGSKVVTRYLQASGTMADLEKLGFNLVGYGCTTCIGNSGPLPEPISKAIDQGDLAVAAVLSGNRNFEGRVNPQTRANYLASPPLVVAYAIAGTVDWDPATEPIGTDAAGKPVYFRDLWPSNAEIGAAMKNVTAALFRDEYGRVFEGDERWRGMPVPTGNRYTWDASSTYIKAPPFFAGMPRTPIAPSDIHGARCLALLGDSITTDHISPAGSIKTDSPAGKYLQSLGVGPKDFNSYGARRGNHEVMMRGTFANIRIKNLMVPGVEGGVTKHVPSGEQLSIYDAAMRYKQDGTSLVVIAGKEYGTGSSRDWAAKGTLLLGVRAVIAESYERIHRSNLVGMGVLPLELRSGQTAGSLGLTGFERFEIEGIAEGLKPGKQLTVRAIGDDGKETKFTVTARVDTPDDVEYYRHGGLLPYVLRGLVGAA